MSLLTRVHLNFPFVLLWNTGPKVLPDMLQIGVWLLHLEEHIEQDSSENIMGEGSVVLIIVDESNVKPFHI